MYTKFNFGWGSAPNPVGGAYDAHPDTLVGWGRLPPRPDSSQRLRRLARLLEFPNFFSTI